MALKQHGCGSLNDIIATAARLFAHSPWHAWTWQSWDTCINPPARFPARGPGDDPYYPMDKPQQQACGLP
ncbi:MAG: hypothetical protein ABWZ08_13720 [Pseudoxanthomonas sp.]